MTARGPWQPPRRQVAQTGDASGHAGILEVTEVAHDLSSPWILAGQDNGWPESEGLRGGTGNPPIFTFSMTEASPFGISYAAGSLWMASLRGQRLWQMPVSDGQPIGEAVAHLVGTYGRLRTVEVAPDGALWVVTSQTDGFGWAGATPIARDDRIPRIERGTQ